MRIELIKEQNDRDCMKPRVLPIGTKGTVLYETTDNREYCVSFEMENYKKSVLVEQSKCVWVG